MPEPPELAFLTAAAAADLIDRGELSPVDLVRACLDQVERHEGRLNCFITLRAEEALAEAASGREGALRGIPLAIKDNIDTAGVRSTGGSKILRDRVATDDAPAWGRLRAAGAVLIGKTNLHELGMGPTNLNVHYGPTRNPWEAERVPGGSSGGTAAAVAVGMAPAGLGTDAGGSVRIPAALCGVVGLKATHGRVPVRGGVAFGNPTVDHIGPIARSVEDAALLLALMAGADPDDPTCSDVPAGEFVAAARSGAAEPRLNGLRIGVPKEHYFDPIDDGVAAAFKAAVAQLERLGARVQDVSLPDHAALMDGVAGLGAESAPWYRPWMRSNLADFSEQVQVRLLSAQFMLASDYATAMRARRLLRRRYDEALAEVDLLAAPTVPVTAPTIAEAEADAFPVGGRPGDASALPRNTRPATLTGLPSISVPCGFDRGLPVGLMLTGRAFDEEGLLRAAAAYEASTEWHRARPPGA